jgi:hypothetical protein
MRILAIIAVICGLAPPALAQLENVPRDPIRMEQERRTQGHGFENSVRQNPQLYPYNPPKQPQSKAPPREVPRAAPPQMSGQVPPVPRVRPRRPVQAEPERVIELPPDE